METTKWYNSKTVIVGLLEILIGALGLVNVYIATGDYSSNGITLLVTGILTIVLRKLTTTPLE